MSPSSMDRSGITFLRQSPGTAVCRVALGFLDRATEAHTRLVEGADPEALHDLRVALRRLRSLLRAYRPWLGELLPRKRRRQLRRLARSTNEARDSEVQLDWLRRLRLRLTTEERAGLRWLADHLAGRRDRAYRHIHDTVSDDFLRIEKALRAILVRGATPRAARTAPGHNVSFGPLTGRLLTEQAEALRRDLAKIRSIADEEELHAARIAGKRLRYLVEPVAARRATAKSCVRALKEFQDDFGALNDGFVRRRLLFDAVREAGADEAARRLGHWPGKPAPAAAPRTDPLPGLLRLAKEVQRDIDRRYAELRGRYLGTGPMAAKLFRSIARLSGSLQDTRTGSRVIDRRGRA